MNYKKAGCFLMILFCLLGNTTTLAATRLISCRPNQVNQRFVCLDDAIAEVKPNLGNYVIYIVAYGSAKRVPCTGGRIAAAFRRQLLDEIEGQRIHVDESLVIALDGGHRDEALIEIYACNSGERPPNSAKWAPNCR
jgi:hypothetical protein